MTGKKTFEIPDWMEPFLDVLGGRSEVERLMSGHREAHQINGPLALMQQGMEAQIDLMHALHKHGMLLAPPGESTHHFEPKWVCGVGRSGFHNGSDCTPDEPHDRRWRCAYYYELSVHATPGNAATLRAHGFHVTEPPEKAQ